MAVVCSLRELQDLVKEVGEAEGVEVVVGATLTKLSDANGMARLLRKMEGTKRWSVEELPKLQPFVEIATAVQQALQVFGKLLPHPLINPEKDIIYMNISIDGPRDELFLKRQADKLHLLGEKLKASNLKGMKKLGRRFVDSAQDVVDRVKFRSVLHSDLEKLRKACRSVYNQEFKI